MDHCAVRISLNSLKQSYCIYVCEDLEHDPDLDRVQKFEMLARSFWMTVKFMECQLCINQETVYQILSDWEGVSSAQNLFCTVSEMSRGAQGHRLWGLYPAHVSDRSSHYCRHISSVLKYNYKTKCQRMVWRTEASLRPKCFCLCRSWSKWLSLLLITGCVP